ncbi:MAG TPA: class I SAM-dependent methyltransferase [Vicinamibacterales bacterium]|nr:class I SAM-dependent methyltransferase [Vicinamibacterales bacterium]
MTPAKRTFKAERLEMIGSLERTHFWFVARRALVLHLLARYSHRNSSVVVDVGCGTGLLAAALARRGDRVVALDFRPEGLRRLEPSGLALWPVQSSATDLPLEAGTADVVLALDVFEHVDDEAAIGEAVRVLKPGGTLVITVPAMPSLWSARDEEAGHLRRYTRRTLVDLIRQAGLELVDIRFYQFLLLPFVVLTRVLGKRWGGTQRAEERPGGLVNRVCLVVNRFEVALSDVVAWPLGSSLAAVARKPVPS